MTRGEYILTGSVRKLGPIDQSGRDTWIATARLSPTSRLDVAVEHNGSGRSAAAAFRAALGDACEAMTERERGERP